MNKQPSFAVVDTLKLSAGTYQQLTSHFGKCSPMASPGQRHETRQGCDGSLVVLCQLIDQAQSDVYFAVRPRDISPSGLGFLHGQFIQPHTPCVMTVIVSRRFGLRVNGTVAHCDHMQKHVHRVGIEFAERISMQTLGLPEPGQQPPNANAANA